MFRIGILGSDNSHALAFSKLCNFPDAEGNYLFEDVRVTAIYGSDDDAEHTKQVAEKGNIEFVAKSPEEFSGKVDAVMAVHRRGSYHVREILPFVEAGYPVWIDKPICTSLEDIQILQSACEKNGTLITGGSTIKYNYDILTMKNRINAGFFGEVIGGNMNFPGDLDSPFEGLFFYGSHLIEMMLTVFGYEVKSVLAEKQAHDRIAVIVGYENFLVTLHYTPFNKDYDITVYGTEKSITAPMDISTIYKLGFEKFVEMLRSKKMPLSFDHLVKPVYVLHAIYKSLAEERRVAIAEIYAAKEGK